MLPVGEVRGPWRTTAAISDADARERDIERGCERSRGEPATKIKSQDSLLRHFDEQSLKRQHGGGARIASARADARKPVARRLTKLRVFEWIRWNSINPCGKEENAVSVGAAPFQTASVTRHLPNGRHKPDSGGPGV